MTRSVEDWGESLESHPVRNTFAVVALVLVLFSGIGLWAQGADFFLYKTFAPRREAVRYQTFKQSAAFKDGKVTYLTRLRADYVRAKDKDTKCAVAFVALHEASTAGTLPDDLAAWTKSLKEDSNMQLKTVVLLAMVLCVACEETSPSSDRVQAAATEALAQQRNAAVGMPAISNFTEAKLVKMLYELRDQADLPTFTYIVDMNGGHHLVCKSIGYGIPYSVQSTNPQRTIARLGSGGVEQLPQAEPNGLFMPDALSATWVMCAAPNGEGVKPVYVEPQILVSPYALD
jgi:hypothetical protein